MFNLFDFSPTAALQKGQAKQPVLPLGNGYSPPIEKKKAPSLFSDEQTAFDAMKRDGVDEAKALEAIKYRRKQLLPESSFGRGEAEIMERMRKDGVSSEEAAAALTESRKNREDERPFWKKAGESLVNASLGVASEVGEQAANVADFAGFPQMKKDMQEANSVLGDTKDTTAFKAGQLAANTAEMLYAPLKATGVVKQAALGAGTGVVGAIADKGSETTAGDVASSALLSAAVPVVAGGASKLVGAGLEKAKKWINPDEATKAIKELSENQKLIQESITPEKLTKKQLEEAVATKTGFKGTNRVTTGKNLLGGETIKVNPTKKEIEIAKLADESGVKFDKGMTRTDKIMSTDAGIERESEQLKTLLQQAPIVPKARVNKFVKESMDKVLQNPEMVGPTESKVAKAYMAKFKEFVNANEGSAAGVLQARKDFDKWIKSTAGEKLYDGSSPAAVVVRTIRESANKFISEVAPDANVLKSLSKQNALYKVKDAISTNVKKSAAEKLLSNDQVKSVAEMVGGGAALYELNKLGSK